MAEVHERLQAELENIIPLVSSLQNTLAAFKGDINENLKNP